MSQQTHESRWAIAHPNAAGIDVGSKSHYVAVPPERALEAVQEFGCHTADLLDMADWLKSCEVDTVALESTGVYWIPLYEVLEASGIEVWLVNAKSVRHVSGRKSDVLDCQWLQQLHTFGLLRRAMRPEARVCEIREVVRLREVLLQERARHVQRMQKALTQMNVQLTSVLSDVVGETGLAIIRAIVAGERDPQRLAQLRNYRVHASEQEIASSLQGTWKDEHLFCLEHDLSCYDFHSRRLQVVDAKIDMLLRGLAQYDKTPARNASKGRAKNAASFDLRGALLNWSGVDLTSVPGIDVTTALKVLAELGPTLHHFETGKRFCSWLGLCPGTRITGGKRISGKSKQLPNQVSRALKLAAMGLSRTHGAMGAYYRQLVVRMGSGKAITAVAHKLARVIYAMLTGRNEYVEQVQDRQEQRYREKAIKNIKRRAAEMGFELVPRQPQALA
ncbi:IS110 family transposase [Pantoea sp. 18069]|uniref:IS110 family transposase n=1 Tax=Pantoea sp. 18069 TaxID=2681415 RepID=UPI00135ADF93|nr:IS110 family transposase [Pantoea sp. 18069]